jgi:hypothetical protein
MLDAYPTGAAGAHFVFGLHNPNLVDFAVVAIEVEVLSYQPIELKSLLHGVGATDITRRFKVTVQSAIGLYRAVYISGQHPSEYIKVLAEKDDRFDVEITTATEGLYQLRVRVVGTIAGALFDVPLDATKSRIVFFDAAESCRRNSPRGTIRYSVAGGITTGASTGAPWIESSFRSTENWRTGGGENTDAWRVMCEAALPGWAAQRVATRSCSFTGACMILPAPLPTVGSPKDDRSAPF